MSWRLRGFRANNDAMHGNGSGSAISRHQFLAEMPEAKVSWLLCIGRLVFQTQTGHASLHRWRLLMHVLTNWSMRSTPECMFVTVDWVPFCLGALTWCIVQRGLALLDHVLLLRMIHLEFFWGLLSSRKNTQAMQDPPESIKCSDG